MPALIEKVPGFKKHVRVFIVHTLATTFQDSTRENMEQCLDLVSARAGRHLRIFACGGEGGCCLFWLGAVLILLLSAPDRTCSRQQQR